jgi:hypothetical protein
VTKKEEIKDFKKQVAVAFEKYTRKESIIHTCMSFKKNYNIDEKTLLKFCCISLTDYSNKFEELFKYLGEKNDYSIKK